MYGILTVEGGLDPEWVKNEMPLYDVEDLIDAIEKRRRPAWEQSRMIAITVANAMGARLKLGDIPFPWDKECAKEETEKPDAERIRMMRERIRQLKKDGK